MCAQSHTISNTRTHTYMPTARLHYTQCHRAGIPYILYSQVFVGLCDCMRSANVNVCFTGERHTSQFENIFAHVEAMDWFSVVLLHRQVHFYDIASYAHDVPRIHRCTIEVVVHTHSKCAQTQCLASRVAAIQLTLISWDAFAAFCISRKSTEHSRMNAESIEALFINSSNCQRSFRS